MNKKSKLKPEPSNLVKITEARQPKKKTVHADPFARIQLHPLEELEARDQPSVDEVPTEIIIDRNNPGLDQDVQLKVGKTKQDQVEPSRTKYSQDQVEPSRTKQDQIELSKTKPVETSPTKNYTKVPNSIAKLAIPEKYFRGLSKHTYDILYQQTRGAINPKREIQLTKNDLVKLTGLAVHTVKLHIKYLNESGLLVTHKVIGQHSGHKYEVLVPEEIEYDQVEPSPTKSNQNLVRVTDQNLVLLGHTNTLENKEVSYASKTSLNTKTVDDDALTGFRARMEALSRKITGNGLNFADSEKWTELGELLAMEAEIAAARTNSISNVPAFLTEHMRRRLSGKPKLSKHPPGLEKKSSNLPPVDEAIEIYEAEPLSEKGRQNALQSLRTMRDNNEPIDIHKGTYPSEDWTWLMNELEK